MTPDQLRENIAGAKRLRYWVPGDLGPAIAELEARLVEVEKGQPPVKRRAPKLFASKAITRAVLALEPVTVADVARYLSSTVKYAGDTMRPARRLGLVQDDGGCPAYWQTTLQGRVLLRGD